ncbi:MAG TPA: 2-succinyl-5-enolpyruvyl-6-hydroxy-3-cyclohexene-1-carboxylic-acid synthase [Muribaculum sp.]|jgi:2-succinyl-5-enolpyruvyl-6-hydroxy-3-cyclohexene-1-carboxylate synthase|uniref:2-succinyl-5-enolpyruvyl-6-hydroxy-3-cyclohexene-1-carboxylate synthase n=1 Tax=Heminiphilus faecis TaxID=2601703 RepID=A0ABV4CX17_9BACT|nr:2-succinyl-5-enolpyruvyl-6-hydroxy-3-cyclohexene-1-carboxylic-acid synthase [Heminiphilus faecis]RLT76626.1 2-succinyl-5-enolpyruvyl-6-hydroxy-3-cyclohexene-1-carboxylic-acid synthase [bacterium J10(2018)]HRF67641.1 2-succinyl-5-enolpyruvyl-6-hydroxy-3-cyclohexene-1-carboxylic-acid synthase [Muribaculum sp.]
MNTTDKVSCNIIVSLLVKHGIEEVVVSPGSRNAPLVLAMSKCAALKKTVVIDERSAAFIALGKASVSGKPAALVCTSGTAVLNYAPAVAEAYYRRVPLIVISADRPMEWIDQDDSQTLRQYEALSHYVKRSYNIPADCSADNMQWYTNRVVNDALLCAVSGRKSPVHINVQLDNPLDGMACFNDTRWTSRDITRMSAQQRLSYDDMTRLIGRCGLSSKIMIIAGFMEPDSELLDALKRLAVRDNVVVMTETVANLHSDMFIGRIDATLSAMDDVRKYNMRPDIVITVGGAIVSRFIKQYLRTTDIKEHWHVGFTDDTVDCFRKLTVSVNIEPRCFFLDLAEALSEADTSHCNFRKEWHTVADEGERVHERYLDTVPWCDLTAMRYVFNNLPDGCNIQLSNGTAVRYAQLFSSSVVARCDCNRGVSGIDGSTSTAVGASTVYNGTTLLITGDMSAQYDIGALAAPCITPKFKMIVLCNGGGGIFRFIKSTSQLEELDEYFVVDRPFPVAKLADAYGFSYFEAYDKDTLAVSLLGFIAEKERPSMLALYTSSQLSAEVLREYFLQKI